MSISDVSFWKSKRCSPVLLCVQVTEGKMSLRHCPLYRFEQMSVRHSILWRSYIADFRSSQLAALTQYSASLIAFQSSWLAGHFVVAEQLLEAGSNCSEYTFDGERVYYVALTPAIRQLLSAFAQRLPPLPPLGNVFTKSGTAPRVIIFDLHWMVTCNECAYAEFVNHPCLRGISMQYLFWHHWLTLGLLGISQALDRQSCSPFNFGKSILCSLLAHTQEPLNTAVWLICNTVCYKHAALRSVVCIATKLGTTFW